MPPRLLAVDGYVERCRYNNVTLIFAAERVHNVRTRLLPLRLYGQMPCLCCAITLP